MEEKKNNQVQVLDDDALENVAGGTCGETEENKAMRKFLNKITNEEEKERLINFLKENNQIL